MCSYNLISIQTPTTAVWLHNRWVWSDAKNIPINSMVDIDPANSYSHIPPRKQNETIPESRWFEPSRCLWVKSLTPLHAVDTLRNAVKPEPDPVSQSNPLRFSLCYSIEKSSTMAVLSEDPLIYRRLHTVHLQTLHYQEMF